MLSCSLRGAAWHRSKLNSVKRNDSVGIDVQFPGVEMMDSRQYRHTGVSGMMPLTSVACLSTNQAMRERVSGGSLFMGCNKFRKEGISSRISCALASTFNLGVCTLDPTTTLVSNGDSHLGSKEGDRSRDGGKTDFLCPGAFETEFLVQKPGGVQGWRG